MSAPALVVRTTDDPAALVPTLRRIVREQDTALALDSVMTMENRLLSSLARPRLYSIVLAVFAGFALLVAGAGLFGVLSYNVAQRTREIGVRAALGAKPVDIMRLIARQGILITAAGVTIGLLAAYELVTLVGKLLYGVTARDPISFVAASMLIGLVASIATVAPVRRAARIEPLKALKQ